MSKWTRGRNYGAQVCMQLRDLQPKEFCKMWKNVPDKLGQVQNPARANTIGQSLNLGIRGGYEFMPDHASHS